MERKYKSSQNQNKNNTPQSKQTNPKDARYVYATVLYNKTTYLFQYTRHYTFKRNQPIIVSSQYGQEIATVLNHPIPYPKSAIENTQFEVIRLANDRDLETFDQNKEKVPETFEIAKEKIKKHRLPIRLIDVHHFLDGKKVLFYFYAENRVDFRSLVKDLANTFKARIELRQIGIRDVSCMLSGFGVCGREYCCARMHTHKESISIKQVKEMNLSLTAHKITGCCGRLMCCLNYEKYMGSESNYYYSQNSDEMENIQALMDEEMDSPTDDANSMQSQRQPHSFHKEQEDNLTIELPSYLRGKSKHHSNTPEED